MTDLIVNRFCEMFDCDAARVSRPCGRSYLILGTRRNTRESGGQWYKDGDAIDFDYLDERVVASGETEEELIVSAEEYKRLQEGGWRYYFEREGIPLTPEIEDAIDKAVVRRG